MTETIRVYEMKPGEWVGYWITHETEICVLIDEPNYCIKTDKGLKVYGKGRKIISEFETQYNVEFKFIESIKK